MFHLVWSINLYLTYTKRFEVIPQPATLRDTSRGMHPDPITVQYIVKPTTRADGLTHRGHYFTFTELYVNRFFQ